MQGDFRSNPHNQNYAYLHKEFRMNSSNNTLFLGVCIVAVIAALYIHLNDQINELKEEQKKQNERLIQQDESCKALINATAADSSKQYTNLLDRLGLGDRNLQNQVSRLKKNDTAQDIRQEEIQTRVNRIGVQVIGLENRTGDLEIAFGMPSTHIVDQPLDH